eukprot:scaffold9997_cov34-Tisochrysis_lutea.AAC.2
MAVVAYGCNKRACSDNPVRYRHRGIRETAIRQPEAGEARPRHCITRRKGARLANNSDGLRWTCKHSPRV